MDFTIQLLMGAGIAAAVGIRPFLPVLLIGAAANADIGFHVEGTDFEFLMSWPFMLAVVGGVGALDIFSRRRGHLAFERGVPLIILATISISLGALEASGSMANGNSLLTALVVGVPVGVACAALGFAAMRGLLIRARKRLDHQAAGALPLFAEGAGLLAAAASILFAPLAIVVIGFLVWVEIGNRRRADQKYAGLRILR